VWLADWLAAAVAFDARTRTTPISATLPHCAARGEAGAESLGVLRGTVGHQPLEPAVQRLLRLGHTSGADLAWGIRTGLSAVLSLRPLSSPKLPESPESPNPLSAPNPLSTPLYGSTAQSRSSQEERS
jgi:hypothetical protein